MTGPVTKFVKVVGEGHAVCVLKCLKESWENEHFSNVSIICKDELNKKNTINYLYANKFILAAASKRFANILADTDEETVLIVPDYERKTFKLFLEYIHSGEILANLVTTEFMSLVYEWDLHLPEAISSTPTDNHEPSVANNSKYSFVEENISLAKIISRKKSKSALISFEGNNLGDEIPATSDIEIEQNPSKSQKNSTAENPESEDYLNVNHLLNQTSSSVPPKVTKKSKAQQSKGSYIFLEAYKKSSSKKVAGKKTVTPEVEVLEVVAPKGVKKPEVKKAKKKVAPKLIEKDPLSIEKFPGEEDEEEPTEEEKADLASSFALYKAERQKNQDISEKISDLSDTIQRFKVYAHHLLGIEPQEFEKNVYKIPCDTCGKMINKDYMSCHIKTHSTEKPYLCDQCGQTFALRCRLRVHQRFQHGEVSLHTCITCGKGFKKAAYLQRHMTLHKGLKPYSCKFCEKKFRLPAVLSKHIRTHTGEKPYECEICLKRFASRSTYVNHKLTHKKKSPLATGSNIDPVTQLLQCEFCHTTFHREYAFIIHRSGHTGETPALPCAHCDQVFPSLKLVREHTNEVHADALYACDVCDGKFANKTTLYAHALIHKHGKRFACDQCDKTFHTKAQHTNHMRSMHSEERPFPCQYCDKNFKSKVTQRQHERTHTDERPYKCTQCPKAFRQGQHLACHLVLHTGERPFVCQFCGKSFAHKNNLNNHIKIHTGDQNKCGICSRIFPSIVKLRRHESTHEDNADDNGENADDIGENADDIGENADDNGTEDSVTKQESIE